jgi:hypothetical protein
LVIAEVCAAMATTDARLTRESVRKVDDAKSPGAFSHG